MRALLASAAQELGKPLQRVAVAAAALGLLALVAALFVMPGPAFAVLTACWLFLAGLAAGSIALSAAARVAHGRFLAAAVPLAESTVAFFPAALAMFAFALLGTRTFIPELSAGAHAFLAARDLGAAAILFFVGWRFVLASRRDRWGPRTLRLAIAYLLLFVLSISLFAADLIVRLTPGAPSGIVPVQAFMAALLAGIAWTALNAARGNLEVALRWDLGRLLYGFSAFWAYLVWCSFLPVWYANLPDEIGEVLARVAPGWGAVSWSLVAASFAVPFVVLLPEAAKRNRRVLAACAISVLAGLTGERFLLLLPPLNVERGPLAMLLGAAIAAGTAGLFLLIVGARLAAEKANSSRLATNGLASGR